MTGRRSAWIGIACLTTSIVLSALGQLGMKAGMRELHLATTLEPVLLWTAAGLACYGVSLLAWLAVLVRYRLSYAYPLLGSSYVLVYVGATHWPRLMEQATPLRTVGTLLIVAGVVLASLPDKSGASLETGLDRRQD